ncbi:MAG: ATP-grasp domain-containing protein [Patescibacteria group bacterium UBA2163]
MKQKVVAVLRGGKGDEHSISLQSGAAILRALSAQQEERQYSVVDIFIDQNGTWYVRGAPRDPLRALTGVDVVWNALHGSYGEDGTVQRILDCSGIPYTGSGSYAAMVSFNKALTKRMLASQDILMPRSVTLEVTPNLENEILTQFRTFCQPSIIKPVGCGSSLGVTLATSFDTFREGIKNAFNYAPQVLIEEYIYGKEATCGVIDFFRGQHPYILPPVEIMLENKDSFFNFDTKYNNNTFERCPGNFSSKESERIKDVARTVHTTLGLRDYSRSDFIVSPRGVYFLEVNALPGTTGESLFPKSLKAVGSSLEEFIIHVLDLALKRG